MSVRSALGRSDLVRLSATSSRYVEDLAYLFGYEALKPQPYIQSSKPTVGGDKGARSVSRPVPLADIPFWRPVAWQAAGMESDADQPALTEKSRMPSGAVPHEAPSFHLLAPWRELEPKLRHALRGARAGRALDIDRIVDRIGEGRSLVSLPRKPASGWTEQLQIVADRSRRLIPIFADQSYVAQKIRRLLPESGFWGAVYSEARGDLVSFSKDGDETGYRLPAAGTPVLVLGDLGCFSGSGRERRFWLDYGRKLRAAGCRAVVLFPGPVHRCAPELAALWLAVPWERLGSSVHGAEALELRAERLLRIVSPASRVEPGLLRALRLLLPPGEADAGTEADFWRHPWLSSDSGAAATVDPAHILRLREEFAEREPPDLRRRVAATIRAWHGDLPREIWYDEVLSLDEEARAGVPSSDLEEARAYFLSFAAQGAEEMPAGDREFQERCAARATQFSWQDAVAGRALMRLHQNLNGHRTDYRPPPGFDPSLVEAPAEAGEILIAVSQIGGTLSACIAQSRAASAAAEGSSLTVLRSLNRLVIVEPIDVADDSFWVSGEAPAWATGWGRDRYGRWAEFTVWDVRQRLRWIPPGRFSMGSPDDEPGRFEKEGPVHEVRIGSGFWMFDTPVTQGLWTAVMGENPSRFPTADRPVERVSWEDAQKFIERIEDLVPGLGLGLPSEAQWEYACRAGGGGAVYEGAFKLLGANNAPALDPIAWYGGNSGVGFELEDGYDSSGWADKQYEHDRAGTRPVKLKRPNGWGLYDMLGNVWEWCEDAWHEDYEDAPTAGRARPARQAGALRVFRGGSWGDTARFVRAASRDWDHPGDRYDNLGFRCVRVQAGAEPVWPAREGQAERPSKQGRTGGAVSLPLDDRQREANWALPKQGGFVIRTDRDFVTFHSSRKSRWATGWGRDRYGLWAEFTVWDVRQRLRWIPPGRFSMGSPDDEPGRYEREGPVHEVRIGSGFWMLDTPVTQGLWSAVMGENPSGFQSPDRPVESVSWEDAQEFIERIEDLVPGLGLGLPSEAQWEYACRAGSTGAIYEGAFRILGENNAPALDPIAWYGGNSGVGFELEEGYDSSDWLEKQHEHERAGTRPVALKRANAWGLYDMLGNVWEWCEDEWHESYDGAPTDGSARKAADAGAGRVFRGGSWGDDARDVRSAFRHWGRPEYRVDFLGFRCVRVQA